MKTFFAILLLLTIASIASAQTYQSPIAKQQPVRPTGVKPAPVTQTRDYEGAIPRGMRGGNVLQMLNPLAPARYGTSAQGVIFEPYTWKWKGIKLFEIVW